MMKESGIGSEGGFRKVGKRATVLLLMFFAMTGGCHYQRAYLSYPVTTGELPVHETAIEGESLGNVYASEGGAVWKECTSVAEGAVWVLIEQTRALGGNAVGNLRWFPEKAHPLPREAVCKQKWGWILVWPILATPAFQRARVEATAYRVEESTHSSSLYVFPESASDQVELVRRIVRDSLSKDL